MRRLPKSSRVRPGSLRNGRNVARWIHHARWIGPRDAGLPVPRKIVCILEPSAFAQLKGTGVGVREGVGVGDRLGRGVDGGVGVAGPTDVVGPTVTSGVSTTGVAIGVGVWKNDVGMGVTIGVGVGVPVGWTKTGSVEVGSPPATFVPAGGGGDPARRATAPTANSNPASSTAPNASNPWPPPPAGSATSARLYAIPAPRPAVVGSRKPHFAQYAASFELRVPQFGQFK
jgi:hypothetical protein